MGGRGGGGRERGSKRRPKERERGREEGRREGGVESERESESECVCDRGGSGRERQGRAFLLAPRHVPAGVGADSWAAGVFAPEFSRVRARTRARALARTEDIISRQ